MIKAHTFQIFFNGRKVLSGIRYFRRNHFEKVPVIP